MGAGVATSPHLSQVRTAAPVRAWRLSWAGRACPVEASFDGGPVGFRPRSCDLGRFPFAVPSAEASGSAGPSKKVGSACASRFFFEDPLHCFGGLRPEGHRPPPRWPRFGTFFPCGKSAPRRERPIDPALPSSRQGESRRFCLWITGISWISRRIRPHPPIRRRIGAIARERGSSRAGRPGVMLVARGGRFFGPLQR